VVWGENDKYPNLIPGSRKSKTFPKFFWLYCVLMDRSSAISTYIGAGDRCVHYLLRHLRTDGSFDYLYDPVRNTTDRKYNLLRHSGTMYAMYQWSSLTG